MLNDDGTPLRWPGALTRNLLRAVDFLPLLYGVGLVAMLLNRDFKRLGDLAAGTVVVYRGEKSAGARRSRKARAGARRRSPLTLEEQRAVLELAERSPTLTQERFEELAELPRPLVGSLRRASAPRRACSAWRTTSRGGNEAGAVRGRARREWQEFEQFLDDPKKPPFDPGRDAGALPAHLPAASRSPPTGTTAPSWSTA